MCYCNASNPTVYSTKKKPLDCKFWVDAITVKTDFVPLLIVQKWPYHTDLTGFTRQIPNMAVRLIFTSLSQPHAEGGKASENVYHLLQKHVCIWSVSGVEAHQGSQGVTVGGLGWTHAYFPSTLGLAQNLQEQCVKAAEEKGWVSLHKHMFSTNERVPNRGYRWGPFIWT